MIASLKRDVAMEKRRISKGMQPFTQYSVLFLQYITETLLVCYKKILVTLKTEAKRYYGEKQHKYTFARNWAATSYKRYIV